MINIIKYPSRKAGFMAAIAISLAVHFGLYVIVRTMPIISVALGMRGVEFVDEDYDRAILIDFSKKLSYPPGYIGFRAPQKTLSLEEIKKQEEKRARLEAQRRKRDEERRLEDQEKLAKREAEEKARVEELAKNAPAPAPANDGYPGGFGKINTAPIRDQIQQLYNANKAGKLVIPDGKVKVGVAGIIKPDGTLANYRIIIPSGVAEIDQAALAILEAVSVSRALGPLHNLSSLSMVLEIDQTAQLHVTGFTSSEQDARAIVDLANTVLLFAKIRKSADPASMMMLNNLKVSRSGQRVQAVISVSRQKATDTLHSTMGNGQG
jgi:hypothetical protein